MQTDEISDKRVESGTLETQLFSWSGWDGDQECMTFYDPILKVQIGKFPPGTKFDSATILSEGKVQFCNYGPEIVEGHIKRQDIVYTAEYKLNLSVGETLSE